MDIQDGRNGWNFPHPFKWFTKMSDDHKLWIVFWFCLSVVSITGMVSCDGIESPVDKEARIEMLKKSQEHEYAVEKKKIENENLKLQLELLNAEK